MRRDLYVGMMASGLFYGGLALLNGHPELAPPARQAVQTVEAFLLPPLPPEEVPTDPDPAPRPRTEVTPPSLPDAPAVPDIDSISQPLQPPIPEVQPDPGLKVIPADFTPGPNRRETIFDPSVLDQQPMATTRIVPVYPFQLKKDGITGSVLVDFVVNANGAVERAYAVSSTNQGFETAAVQGVNKWRFRPGRKNGVPVRTHMQIPIVFSLHDAD